MTWPSTNVILALTSLILCHVALTSALSLLHPSYASMAKVDKTAEPLTMPETGDSDSAVECPRRHYFSEEQGDCKACSACPINQIIRRPCLSRSDTVCGPFLEFDHFHQAPGDSRPEVPNRLDEEQVPALSSKSMEESEHQWSVSALKDSSNQWRTLSFALIAVLTFICCLVVIVALYVYTVLRRSHNTQKVIITEPGMLAARRYPDSVFDERYVELPVTSRDIIRSSRHLPPYQQVFTGDDVSHIAPLTPSECDVKERDVTAPEEEREHLCVYVNTAALDGNES